MYLLLYAPIPVAIVMLLIFLTPTLLGFFIGRSRPVDPKKKQVLFAVVGAVLGIVLDIALLCLILVGFSAQ